MPERELFARRLKQPEKGAVFIHQSPEITRRQLLGLGALAAWRYRHAVDKLFSSSNEVAFLSRSSAIPVLTRGKFDNVQPINKEIPSPYATIEGTFQRVYYRFGGESAIEITQPNGDPAIIFCWDQMPLEPKPNEPTNVKRKFENIRAGQTININKIPTGNEPDY